MSDFIDDGCQITLKEIREARWGGAGAATRAINAAIRKQRDVAHAQLFDEIARGVRDSSVVWVLDASIEDGLPVMTWRPAREGEAGWLMKPGIAAMLRDMRGGGDQ